MCSGSEAGSYFRLIDFVYHSTLGLRVIKKKKKKKNREDLVAGNVHIATVLVAGGWQRRRRRRRDLEHDVVLEVGDEVHHLVI